MRVRNVAAETAPTGSATITLFDSFVAFLGMRGDVERLTHHTVVITNSQAGTLLLRKSDNGTTWDVVSSTAISIPSGSATVSTKDFVIEGLPFYQVQWVNGGVDQDATWRIAQTVTEKQRAATT
jgi:hypothetical protein